MNTAKLRLNFQKIASHKKLIEKSQGVTLLELGIVLIVIGFIISGGYIAYDYFITRAKTTKTMIEMKDYRKGFESFHSVYGAFPGDMTSASRRIDSNLVNGNGDGKIASEAEQNAFWPHMSYSKMISKPSGGNYETLETNVSPKVGVNLPRLQDSDDIAIGVIYNTPSGVRANSFILGGVDGRAVTLPRFSVTEAQIMDQKFDDNNPASGGIMCGKNTKSGTILVCSYVDMTAQSDASIFIPFTPQTTDASNSCPAQSLQISQQLVANVPSIAANATATYNCRDINPSYAGTYTVACNQSKDSNNNIVGYTIATTSTSCSLKSCVVPNVSSISGAASVQSTAVLSGQYLSYTCNSGMYATKSLCSPNLTTDAASLNPAPACTSSPTGVAGNIPIYAPDAQTFKDSGKNFNDEGSTASHIFSASKILGLFRSTTASENYLAKYSTQNAGVVPSSIYDNGTSVAIGTSTPNASTILELNSTTKAFLPPRMTTAQMNVIASPLKGMIIFNTTENVLYQHNGTAWSAVNGTVPVSGATPVGTISVWSSTTAPNGWVLVDGQTVTSSSNYPELCQVLNSGTACGSGVTKTVPDFRGYFLRGLGGIDPDVATRTIGTIQGDAIRNIIGKVNIGFENSPSPTNAFYESNISGDGVSGGGKYFANINFDASRVVPTAAENRPTNIAVNYIMKAQSANLTTVDVNNILSQMMSAVLNSSTANSLVMFDSTVAKFQSSGLSQVSEVLTYNPTGLQNLMSLSSAGMLLKPASGIALQVGESGTGIANANSTSGLTTNLDFYVNGAKKMFLDANGNLTVTSLSLSSTTTLSPTTLTVGAGGLSTTTLSASGTSTLANISVSGTSTLTGLLTANGGIKFGTTAPTTPSVGTVYYDTTTNSLQMSALDVTVTKWFRILTRKDIISFTITGSRTDKTFDLCSTTDKPNAIVPLTAATLIPNALDGQCATDLHQFIAISIPFAIQNPVIHATWVVGSGSAFGTSNDVNEIFITEVVTNASTTTFKLAISESYTVTQYNKINVTVINPN